MNESLKKFKKYLVIALVVLLITIVGFSAAYFQAQVGSGTSASITASTKSTDLLTFSKGNNISINANQSNFYNGAGNLSGSTTATASLKANSATNSASNNYNLYLYIQSNYFEYTTDGETPELLLTIIDPSNQAVTSISGLTYTTVNGVSGFDITEESGIIQIASNYLITSSSSTIATNQTWNITVTLVNLNSDQEDNTDKSFTAQVIIQKDVFILDFDICSSGTNVTTCIQNIYLAGGEGNGGLYYHDGEGTYGEYEAEDNSYRFSGASSDLHNYVCFGSSASTCPEDNLYRIIGSFNNGSGYQVKLVKDTFAPGSLLGEEDEEGVGEYGGNNSYWWSRTNISRTDDNGHTTVFGNIWEDTYLNTLHLNTNYLSNIGSTWSNKISTTNWKVGGFDNYSQKVKSIFEDEITYTGTMGSYISLAFNYYGSSKIGLIYVSDYGYAAAPSVWNSYNVNNYNNSAVSSVNWLKTNYSYWSITRSTDDWYSVYSILDDGRVGAWDCYFSRAKVRPTFYLKSSIKLNGVHEGTASDPIRIN